MPYRPANKRSFVRPRETCVRGGVSPPAKQACPQGVSPRAKIFLSALRAPQTDIDRTSRRSPTMTPAARASQASASSSIDINHAAWRQAPRLRRRRLARRLQRRRRAPRRREPARLPLIGLDVFARSCGRWFVCESCVAVSSRKKIRFAKLLWPVCPPRPKQPCPMRKLSLGNFFCWRACIEFRAQHARHFGTAATDRELNDASAERDLPVEEAGGRARSKAAQRVAEIRRF